MKFDWKAFVYTFIPVLLNVIASTFVTVYGMKKYSRTREAPFTPPKWVFMIVWLAMYTLIALSGYYTYSHYPEGSENQKLYLSIFYLQILLNVLWCVAFFGMGDARIALICIVAILGTVIYLSYQSFQIYQPAMWMIFPYLIWLIFATFLNIGYISVNQL